MLVHVGHVGRGALMQQRASAIGATAVRYASRVTSSWDMQHLRACRKATTKRPAAARHAYHRARRGGALRLAFVNEGTHVLHATLEPIAGS